jgi:hypothetical protein
MGVKSRFVQMRETRHREQSERKEQKVHAFTNSFEIYVFLALACMVIITVRLILYSELHLPAYVP